LFAGGLVNPLIFTWQHPEVDHFMRLAFGTFMQVPDPADFAKGIGHLKTCWIADPNAAFAAQVYSKLVGSNFATRGVAAVPSAH
jgi:hypothetical protein